MIDYDLCVGYGVVVSAEKYEELINAITDPTAEFELFMRPVNQWTNKEFFIGCTQTLDCSGSFYCEVDTFENLAIQDYDDFLEMMDKNNLWKIIDWKPTLQLINFCF